ncbi:MAG TPA: DUF308 domain-containing protein [Sphingomonas sp.]|nr:DUF308 domain-containing protein [Sphingomonas sp.]
MTMMKTIDAAPIAGTDRAAVARLRSYYAIRALVSGLWVAAAFLVGATSPIAAAILLVAYPAWDAVANLIDGARSGGLAQNRPQAINVIVSALTAVAVAISLADTATVVRLFGIWAIVAGLLQLATGVARWKTYKAQWAMILSGAQSALAGGFFIKQSLGPAMPAVTTVAPYAALGALYFLVSALLLLRRR